jgi:WD40 repeat protein
MAITSLMKDNSTLIKVWDLNSGTEICANQNQDVGSEAFEFNSTGKILMNNSSFEIKMWDATNCQLMRIVKIERPRQKDLDKDVSTAFSPDGKLLAGNLGNEINIWNAQTGRREQVLRGHTAPVSTVLFSVDGKVLISGSHDKTIKVWDLQTGKVLKTLLAANGSGRSIAFDRKKKILISASSDGIIRIWRITV